MTSSIFSIFDLGIRGMAANQIALNITGQNIANANNENYVRQRAEMVESVPLDSVPGQVGTGVKIEQIIRVKDEFSDFQLRKENQTLGYLDEKQGILTQLESIFQEPSEHGLNSLINDFYNSLNDLATNPENFSARLVVRESAVALTDFFNGFCDKVAQLKSGINDSIQYKVAEVNTITAKIADLNGEIARVEGGGSQNANDLRNQRDGLIRDLSEYGDLFVMEDNNNLLSIQFGDQILVNGVNQIKLETESTDGRGISILTESGQALNLRNGSLQGLIDCRDVILDQYSTDMDSIARKLIDEINSVHVGGMGFTRFQNITSETGASSSSVPLKDAGFDFDVTGGSFALSLYNSDGGLISENSISVDPFSDTLEDIAAAINAVPGFEASISSDRHLSIGVTTSSNTFSFVSDSTGAKDTSGFLKAIGLNTFFTGDSAYTIGVADTIINDVNKIATGRTTSPADNAIVVDMIETRNNAVLNDTTFEGFYSSLIADLGIKSKEAQDRSDTQELIIQSLKERQQEQSGVSFDEEAINLIRFQRGYQSAAKFVQVVDGLIQSLIQMV